ncbi:MAG: hypothetical protein ACKO2V_02290 [Snowella sp.]
MPEPQLNQLHQKIDQGVNKAIAEAIEKHRKLGEAIAVWQNGEVVILSSDEIPNLENQNSSLH